MKQHRSVPVQNIIRIALGVGALLVIPLILTLLNPNASIYGGGGGGWDWMPGDFVVMGALLFVTGVAINFTVRNVVNPVYRSAAVVAIILALLAIWTELAVDAVSRLIEFLLS